MKSLTAALAFVSASVLATPADAQSEPFLSEVMIIATNFCPVGWAAMNGQLLPISQNTALFALLGTNYGGDGKSTFALPLAKPLFTATGATLTQCIALQGIFPSRQ